MNPGLEDLKVIIVGREFQFIEVIGTKVLANEVVQHNATAKGLGLGESRATRKAGSGGKLLASTM